MGRATTKVMSKEKPGFIGEDGQFYEYPKPLMNRDISDEGLQAWIDASYDVVESGLFSERMVGYHRHLIHGYYSDIIQERGWEKRKR